MIESACFFLIKWTAIFCSPLIWLRFFSLSNDEKFDLLMPHLRMEIVIHSFFFTLVNGMMDIQKKKICCELNIKINFCWRMAFGSIGSMNWETHKKKRSFHLTLHWIFLHAYLKQFCCCFFVCVFFLLLLSVAMLL